MSSQTQNEQRHEYDADHLAAEIGWNIKDLWNRTEDGVKHMGERMHHRTSTSTSSDNARDEPTVDFAEIDRRESTVSTTSTTSTGSTHSISLASHLSHAKSHNNHQTYIAAKETTPEELAQMQAGFAHRESVASLKGSEKGGYYSSKYMPGFDEDTKRFKAGEPKFKW